MPIALALTFCLPLAQGCDGRGSVSVPASYEAGPPLSCPHGQRPPGFWLYTPSHREVTPRRGWQLGEAHVRSQWIARFRCTGLSFLPVVVSEVRAYGVVLDVEAWACGTPDANGRPPPEHRADDVAATAAGQALGRLRAPSALSRRPLQTSRLTMTQNCSIEPTTLVVPTATVSLAAPPLTSIPLRPIAAAFLLAGVCPAQTTGPALDIGAEAPELHGLGWIKGDPVTVEAGKVVVVEFWTTWCAVCRASIPTLTKLQRAGDDVAVVGIASARFERPRERVEKFVAEWNAKIGYAVAWDGKGTAAAEWLDASGQRGLPVTFVVDKDRRVAWIGTPRDGLTDVVARIVGGAFDIDLARRVSRLQRELSKAMVRGDRAAILDVTERWIAVDPTRSAPWISRFKVLAESVTRLEDALQCARSAIDQLAKTPVELARFANEGLFAAPDAAACYAAGLQAIRAAFAARDDDPQLAVAYFSALAATHRDEQAEKVARRAIELAGDDAGLLASLAGDFADPRYGKRFAQLGLEALHRARSVDPDNHMLDRAEFDLLALVVRDEAAARNVGERLLRKARLDDAVLNEFAWSLLDSPSYRGRFDALALAAAEIVHKLPGGNNWAYVDTLARAKFVNGQVDEAVELQRQALEHCDVPRYLSDLKERLRVYEKAVAERRK